MGKERLNYLKYIALVNYIGFSIAAPIVGGILIGRYLDERFNTRFIFLIIFIVLGVISGFRNLFLLTIKKPGRK
jgi:ATP synthase protein I